MVSGAGQVGPVGYRTKRCNCRCTFHASRTVVTWSAVRLQRLVQQNVWLRRCQRPLPPRCRPRSGCHMRGTSTIRRFSAVLSKRPGGQELQWRGRRFFTHRAARSRAQLPLPSGALRKQRKQYEHRLMPWLGAQGSALGIYAIDEDLKVRGSRNPNVSAPVGKFGN